MERKNKSILSTFCSIFLISVFLPVQICLAGSIDSIEISPDLDITRFAGYNILATLTGSPISVTADIIGINGQIAPGDPMYWDYYVDGTPKNESQIATMTYNSSLGKWTTPNIYPDSIYPEIYFADNDITWYNAPSNIILQKNSYQLLHFTNPFTMVGDMSFFIEVNAVPRATNSSNLEIYVVKKGKSSNFFTTDWRTSADVELVRSITNSESFHHVHTDNAAHYLTPLSTNSDGTIGTKHLDVSGDFWVIIYTQAPNNNRGWDFKYHPTCDNLGMLYQGSQSGWTVSAESGCPDSHVHMVRRDAVIKDGVEVTVTADFGGEGTEVETDSFYFLPQPNLPPIATSFTSPLVGGTYDGGGTDQITVSWDPASDPDNDPLLYSIYLLNSSDQVIDTLVTNTSGASYTWDISGVNNGTYKLKGIITEDILTDPKSTDFFMDGYFTINKTVPVYSLSSVSITSDNVDTSWGKAGDQATLSFTATGTITPTVNIYSGGDPVNNTISVTNPSGNNWQAVYTISSSDTDGVVSFSISADNLDTVYSDTTDSSYIITDVTSPANVIATPDAGTYDTSQNVSLSSTGSDFIKYTTNGSTPDCSTGDTYVGPILVSSPKTIKAIACDSAGNFSSVSSFDYAFQYTVTYDAQGGIVAPSSQPVTYGSTVSELPIPTRTGYTFSEWNTDSGGGGSTFDGSTIVTSNLTVYAQWTINSYTVTYYGNGNDGGSDPAEASYDYGMTATISSAGTLTKTNYTFYGWNTASDGSGASYAPNDLVNMTGDLDLYAQWTENAKCTITFNGTGGTGHTPGSITVNCGQSLFDASESLPSDPTKTGYTFSEWNTAFDGSGSTFDTSVIVNSNITVYAQYTGNLYTITFDAQGGTVAPSSQPATYGSTVGVLPTPTKTGYTFSEWNSSSDGSGTTYDSSTVYSTADNITLYAQYTGNSYTITFDAQGGTVAPSSQPATYGSTVGALPTPTKTGYTFSEWNSSSDGSGTTYDSSTVYSTADNITLYAQYTGNSYTIAFNSGGGTSTILQSVTYASAVGALPVTTRTGYTFDGWYTEPYGTGDLFTSGTVYSIAENSVLFANWNANSYTITFDAQGGTVAPSSQPATYGSTVGVLPTPTKTGYTFSEWNSSSDGSGTTYDSSTVYSVAGSITLYAQWTTITYTLNYSTGGDGVLSGGTFQTVVHGGSGASVTATPNSGYKFIRWSDGITDNPRTDTNVFADLSVSAVFDYITPPGSGGGYRSVVNSPVSNIIPGTEKTTTKTTDTKTSVSDQQFPDTDSAHPAYQSLINLNKKNIIGGDALTGNARLNDFINRAEMAKLTSFVQKSETNNALSFPDVNKEIWYYSFINTAQKKGIMGGYGDGFFRPDNFLNYAEFFKILAISLGYTTKVEAENQALESGKEWYAVYIELLDNNQMLPDWAKEKSVADFVTRGEAFMLFDGASGE